MGNKLLSLTLTGVLATTPILLYSSKAMADGDDGDEIKLKVSKECERPDLTEEEKIACLKEAIQSGIRGVDDEPDPAATPKPEDLVSDPHKKKNISVFPPTTPTSTPAPKPDAGTKDEFELPPLPPPWKPDAGTTATDASSSVDAGEEDAGLPPWESTAADAGSEEAGTVEVDAGYVRELADAGLAVEEDAGFPADAGTGADAGTPATKKARVIDTFHLKLRHNKRGNHSEVPLRVLDSDHGDAAIPPGPYAVSLDHKSDRLNALQCRDTTTGKPVKVVLKANGAAFIAPEGTLECIADENVKLDPSKRRSTRVKDNDVLGLSVGSPKPTPAPLSGADAGTPEDAGTPYDAGEPDAGFPIDAGTEEADGGMPYIPARDAGEPADAGEEDASFPIDAGEPDAGFPADAGTEDAGTPYRPAPRPAPSPGPTPIPTPDKSGWDVSGTGFARVKNFVADVSGSQVAYRSGVQAGLVAVPVYKTKSGLQVGAVISIDGTTYDDVSVNGESSQGSKASQVRLQAGLVAGVESDKGSRLAVGAAIQRDSQDITYLNDKFTQTGQGPAFYFVAKAPQAVGNFGAEAVANLRVLGVAQNGPAGETNLWAVSGQGEGLVTYPVGNNTFAAGAGYASIPNYVEGVANSASPYALAQWNYLANNLGIRVRAEVPLGTDTGRAGVEAGVRLGKFLVGLNVARQTTAAAGKSTTTNSAGLSISGTTSALDELVEHLVRDSR